MGKIYCAECGTELDESMNFCSNCGAPLDDKSTNLTSNEIKKDSNNHSNENSLKIKEKPKTNNKYSTSTKVFLGVAGVSIILFIIGIIVIGSVITNSIDNTDSNVDTSNLSPSFTDTICGINFQIPEGYETFDGTDNKNMGTSTKWDRSYIGPNASMISISVSTTQGNFYWDLSQNRAYNDMDVTINGHDGILDSGGSFRYVTDGKLVMINGADEQQLESIIIE